MEPQTKPIDVYNDLLKQRRQFLQEIIDEAKSRLRISRGMKLAVFELSAELIEEVVEQINATMHLNCRLMERCQALRVEQFRLAAENRNLMAAVMDRKHYRFEGNA